MAARVLPERDMTERELKAAERENFLTDLINGLYLFNLINDYYLLIMIVNFFSIMIEFSHRKTM